MFVVGSSAIK